MNVAAATEAKTAGPDVVASLDKGVRAELALLTDLVNGLVEQRQAIAADDSAGLEQVVQQLSRTLLTLREARRQRALLVELVTGRADAKLTELLASLPANAQPAMTDLCRALRDQALAAGRELAINQTAIRRAIESGERFLQHLLTGPNQDDYRERPMPSAAGGLLLNQRA